MKKIIFIFTFSVLCITASASKAYIKGQDFAYGVVNEEKLRQEVEFLSEKACAGRLCGTAGNVEAQWHIIRRFKEAKLDAIGKSYMHPFAVNVDYPNTMSRQKQNFTPDGCIVGHNIIGMMPSGGKKVSDKYVVVMTHHDGHGILDGTLYGGADSECSGIVALTTLAKMLTTHRMITGDIFSKNIIFVSLDAHNYSLAGAEALRDELRKGTMKNPRTGRSIKLADVDMVINIDQIGSGFAPITSGNPKYMIMLSRNTAYAKGQELLTECNRFYRTGLQLGFNYYGSQQFTEVFSKLSDQRPFVESGKSTVLFTSGITFRTNKENDNAASLDYPILKSRIILIFRYIEKIVS